MLINFVCMDQFWYCGFLNICLGQGKFLLPLDFLIFTALITQSCLYLSRQELRVRPELKMKQEHLMRRERQVIRELQVWPDH